MILLHVDGIALWNWDSVDLIPVPLCTGSRDAFFFMISVYFETWVANSWQVCLNATTPRIMQLLQEYIYNSCGPFRFLPMFESDIKKSD